MSVEENDQSELRKVIVEMRKLQLASVQPDIQFGEEELIYILIKKGKVYLYALFVYPIYQ